MSTSYKDVWGCVTHATPIPTIEHDRRLCKYGRMLAEDTGMDPHCHKGWVPGWSHQHDPGLTYRQK